MMDQKTTRKTFARLGVTFQLTYDEFALITAGGDAAHDLIKDKVAQRAFKLDGETYFPACPVPHEGEFYHEDDLDFAFQEAGDGRTYIVTELCSHCENEIEMRWNTDERGFKAFCPVCGGQLMLCDECRHAPDGERPSRCDYDRMADTCHRGKVNGKEAEETPAMADLFMSEYDNIRSMSDEQMAD